MHLGIHDNRRARKRLGFIARDENQDIARQMNRCRHWMNCTAPNQSFLYIHAVIVSGRNCIVGGRAGSVNRPRTGAVLCHVLCFLADSARKPWNTQMKLMLDAASVVSTLESRLYRCAKYALPGRCSDSAHTPKERYPRLAGTAGTHHGSMNSLTSSSARALSLFGCLEEMEMTSATERERVLWRGSASAEGIASTNRHCLGPRAGSQFR